MCYVRDKGVWVAAVFDFVSRRERRGKEGAEALTLTFSASSFPLRSLREPLYHRAEIQSESRAARNDDYSATRRTGTRMLQISAPPAGTMKNGSRRLAMASA